MDITVWIYSTSASGDNIPKMYPRIIRVSIERERALYDELFSAMMEGREYEGGYIMQCAEHRGGEGQMVAEFTLRDPKGHP